jgi:hypothetical protein
MDRITFAHRGRGQGTYGTLFQGSRNVTSPPMYRDHRPRNVPVT